MNCRAPDSVKDEFQSKKSNTKDDYKQIAPFYDAGISPLIAPIRREVCRIALSQNFRSILDIGCGTGEQCIMLNRLGFRVTGVDLSPSMLEVAKRKSPKTIPYYLQDASSLAFEAHSFDCSMLSFALHEQSVETRGRMIQEAKRVLKNDGRIIIVDYLTAHKWTSSLAQIFAGFIEGAAGYDHFKHYKNYMRIGAMATVLEQSDLLQLRVRKFYLGLVGVVLAMENSPSQVVAPMIFSPQAF